MKTKIAFVAATISESWGGSEELWSQAAIQLLGQGVSVAASIDRRLPLHHRVRNLMQNGVKVWLRPDWYPLWNRLGRRILSGRKADGLVEVEKFLYRENPDLVVLSTGGALPTIEWIELCRDKGWPFVTIGQANSECWWFDDETAARYR